MTRAFFQYLSTQKALRKWIESSAAAKKLTRRFIAGETLAEELDVCASLQQQGVWSTLDHLGENVTTPADAASSRDAYMEALKRIAERGLPATVSIKLTQFGLDLGEGACLANVRALAAKAKDTGSRVEIDMESSAYTDRTIAVAQKIGAEYGCVRAVIQAYLRRSAADIERLNAAAIPVRLCKGAYNEPASIAFAEKREVDRNYAVLMKTLLERGAYPAIATHDELILGDAFRYVRERKIAPEKFEFQMLYGIRRDLQKRIVDFGFRLRVYVPYGTEWYPYFMRRLAERPANAWFLVRNLFR
jgi:proline dehydrogenase